VTTRAPFRPLSAGAMYHVVSSRLELLGIQVPHHGPHCLRHACAGHLVSAGLSLKEVGDHLSHRSAYATRIYAKVDLVGLREVADFDLRELIRNSVAQAMPQTPLAGDAADRLRQRAA
jgi:integrase/recombinase XerD